MNKVIRIKNLSDAFYLIGVDMKYITHVNIIPCLREYCEYMTLIQERNSTPFSDDELAELVFEASLQNDARFDESFRKDADLAYHIRVIQEEVAFALGFKVVAFGSEYGTSWAVNATALLEDIATSRVNACFVGEARESKKKD
jgi:hypothetical protein